MTRVVIPTLLAITLGGGFGVASAEVVASDGSSMTVDIQVGVQTSADAVVAHLVAPGDPELTLPLVSRGDELFGILTELPVIDYQVVFEAVGELSVQSQAVTLSELGVEFNASGAPVPVAVDDADFSTETIGWGWLALGMGAASLSALAFWVLGGEDRRGRHRHPDDAESVEPS